ncbi:PLD-like domain-containing protein [Paenibacillus sp. 1_12]|uniref:phospholipase D family protein n=1 Tax=Paenibacillus sp. 1_12 TaxID=1566278 RepID=UPI0008F2747B|nr:phospholipase D family protein [Paenibacillus sp. 1_12]SFL90609.1 PLD-like domain-containing protein [Paenibacillus sp. 1_12]
MEADHSQHQSASQQDLNNNSSEKLPSRSRTIRNKQRRLLISLCLIILWLTIVMIYQTHKPLPPGLSMEGPVHHVKDVEFLYDLTYKKPVLPIQETMIFDRVFQVIDEAEQFIVIDMFLFNSYYKEGTLYTPLSGLLTEKLLEQKKRHPTMPIIFITDEVNTMYGSAMPPELERLKAGGIDVVISDVNPLRDSIPSYSAFWRTFVQWFGQTGKGWLPNPMVDTAPSMSVRSYLKLVNVKANHRKVIATERALIVPSANAHDASAYNSNSAFLVRGDIIADALASEQAVIAFSRGSEDEFHFPQYIPDVKEEGDIEVQLLTEGKIHKHVLQSLSEAGVGDRGWMGMFYLADRQVIKALIGASKRGAELRLILDSNQNAFGRDKIGIPNRPVAKELLDASDNRIQIRWYNGTDEQYHTKLLFIDKTNRIMVNNGSANFTERNLDDLNLETNLGLNAPGDSRLALQLRQYFNRLWNNEGAPYTLDYEAFKDKTVWIKDWMYRLQEWLGLTTF